MNPATIARFNSKVQRGDGCWLWMAGAIRGGYGSFKIGNQMVLAHRFAYELATGRPPGRLEVMHHCDNPRCVRPDHLALATHAENMRDAATKGRMRHMNQLCGERHPLAKLTWPDVLAIRQLAKAGETQQAIARHFGVCRTQVSHIVNRKNWVRA